MRRSLILYIACLVTLLLILFLGTGCSMLNPLWYTDPPHICVLRWKSVGPNERDLDALQQDILEHTRATHAISQMLDKIEATLTAEQLVTFREARQAMWLLDAAMDSDYEWQMLLWDMWWNEHDGKTKEFWDGEGATRNGKGAKTCHQV